MGRNKCNMTPVFLWVEHFYSYEMLTLNIYIVSLAAIFSLVTQHSSLLSCGEECCVTRLKMAARESSI